MLLFAVIRPALRQIINPTGKRRKASTVDVTVVDQDDNLETDTIALGHQVDPESQQRVLASTAYEDRLRNAREAVKNDSKQVAQVMKDWVAVDE